MFCPTCGAACPPDARFCPVDGTPLGAAPAAQPPVGAAPRASLALPIAIGGVGLAGVALLAVVLLRPAAPAPQPAPAPLPAVPAAAPRVEPATPDPEPMVQPAPVPAGDYRMVSTPHDGYLSIRSEPDGRGVRLDRMLDGEVVQVLTCGPPRVVDGDAGHWCRVRRQSGQEGWGYDAYLAVYDDVPM